MTQMTEAEIGDLLHHCEVTTPLVRDVTRTRHQAVGNRSHSVQLEESQAQMNVYNRHTSLGSPIPTRMRRNNLSPQNTPSGVLIRIVMTNVRKVGRQRRASAWTTPEEQSRPDDFNNCLICTEALRVPRILECQHTFDEDCLQRYFDYFNLSRHHSDGGVSVPCPTCRTRSQVPKDGLPKPSSNQLLDDVTATAGVTYRRTQLRRRLSSLIMDSCSQKCDPCYYQARGGEAEFYCPKCQMNYCAKCKALHSSHELLSEHALVHISNKVYHADIEKLQSDFGFQTQESLSLYCIVHNKLQSGYFCSDCILPCCTVCVLQEHHDHQALKLREALLLRRDCVRALVNVAQPTLDMLETALTPLQSPNQSAELLNKMADSGMIQVEHLKSLMDFSSRVMDVSQSRRLLAVYEDLVDRLKTVIDCELKVLERDVMSRKLLLTKAVATQQHPLLERKDSPLISAVSDWDDENRQLRIKPELIWKVEKQKGDLGELWNPCDVTFLPYDDVAVAEYDITNDRNNRIRLFDNKGWAKGVLAQGEIKPLGLCRTREGHLAVTDCIDKRVKIYSVQGQLEHEFGKGHFGWPYGIASTSKGALVISDAFNDVILIYTPDGKKIRQFGGSGTGLEQLKNPYHICVDSDDNIIVSDYGNNIVKVFDQAGQFLYHTSNLRSRAGVVRDVRRARRRLRGPRGVCVDMHNQLFVADEQSRVCIFDQKGKFVRYLLTEEDAVRFPESLALNSQGLMAVTEWNPQNMFAVKVFNLYH